MSKFNNEVEDKQHRMNKLCELLSQKTMNLNECNFDTSFSQFETMKKSFEGM